MNGDGVRGYGDGVRGYGDGVRGYGDGVRGYGDGVPGYDVVGGRGVQGLGRREFLGVCGGAVACAAIAGCASVVARPVTVIDGRITLDLADHPGLRAPNSSLSIQPSGLPDPLLVLNRGEGRFAVLSPICTHRGCTVEVAGDRLECPCHGSTYDRDGAVLAGPAERALARYPAIVAGGRLVIDIGRAP